MKRRMNVVWSVYYTVCVFVFIANNAKIRTKKSIDEHALLRCHLRKVEHEHTCSTCMRMHYLWFIQLKDGEKATGAVWFVCYQNDFHSITRWCYNYFFDSVHLFMKHGLLWNMGYYIRFYWSLRSRVYPWNFDEKRKWWIIRPTGNAKKFCLILRISEISILYWR